MWTYDAQAKAVYFRRSDKPVARTVEGLPGQQIDLDADGQVVGVEVLDQWHFGSPAAGRTVVVSGTGNAQGGAGHGLGGGPVRPTLGGKS